MHCGRLHRLAIIAKDFQGHVPRVDIIIYEELIGYRVISEMNPESLVVDLLVFGAEHGGGERNRKIAILFYSLSFTCLHFYRLLNLLHFR